MASVRGNSEAMPHTVELNELPSYPAATDEGRPPAYSEQPISSTDPGLLDRPGYHSRVNDSHRNVRPLAKVDHRQRRFLFLQACNPRGRDKQHRFIQMLFASCLIAALISGVVYAVQRRNEDNKGGNKNVPVVSSPVPSQAPRSTIYDLAATECEAGTFIFHQDRAGDVWVRGNTHVAPSNQSTIMAPTRLSSSHSPSRPANMTAVCWSISEFRFKVALYFVSPLRDYNSGTNYAIIESIIDIDSDAVARKWKAVINRNWEIIPLRKPSSLAAVILPSTGIRLYYLDQPKDSNSIDITEVNRGHHPELGGDIDTSKRLNVAANSTYSPITAAAADTNDRTLPPVVHVFFIDDKLRLSRVVRSGNETYPAQPLNQRLNSGPSISIEKMAAIIPHINDGIPEADLFFKVDNKIKHIIGAEIPSGYTASNAPFIYIPTPSPVGEQRDGTNAIPEATQEPPLLAVTCWNHRGNKSMGIIVGEDLINSESMQLIYVKSKASTLESGNIDDLGDGIVKVTGTAWPKVGYGWAGG